MNGEKELIPLFNDELRRDLTNGGAFMTMGVAALGPDLAERIFDAITLYDDFCQESDPYQEHDFGSLRIDGHSIHYFSNDMSQASPDPSNLSVTKRILTIMLAEEY